MMVMVVILICLLVIASVLLYQIALKYNTWITTLSIVVTLSFSILAAIVVYDNMGYPKEINFFENKWVMLHHVPSDENNTFYIMILEKGPVPRLISFRISDKEKYEKQKEGLRQAGKRTENGELVTMEFNSETEEFVEHKFNLAERYKK